VKLGLRRSGETLVIYREKWCVLALGLFLGAALIGFAAWFYWLAAPHAPPVFIIPLCLAFAVAGLWLLSRLPADARKWFAEDGAITLKADAAGVEIGPFPGARPQYFPWAAVGEIALAKTVKSIESDETCYNWNALLIFLAAGDYSGANWFDPVKAGLGRTGKGRVYLMLSYPRKQAEETETALRAVAPAAVIVGRYKSVVFDQKKRSDCYVEG
jgi:hypothetical protein